MNDMGQVSVAYGPSPGDLKDGLSVVIPVYNKGDDLAGTLESILAAVSGARQIILVDDASSDDSGDIIRSYVDRFPEIVSMSLPQNRGAGVARNAGIRLIRHNYTIFFDADDRLEPGSLDDWLAMARQYGSDIAMCQYKYVSNGNVINGGMHAQDRRIWASANKTKAPEVVNLDENSNLLEFTNYPWNKIYRTRFLLENDLLFSGTPVNNDIFFHWVSLCLARRILLIPEAYCTHFVAAGVTQITQDFSRRRLCIFDAFNDVEAFFDADPELKRLYYVNFLRFKIDLIRWAHRRLPLELVAEFEEAVRDHYAQLVLKDAFSEFERMPNVVTVSALAAHSPQALIRG